MQINQQPWPYTNAEVVTSTDRDTNLDGKSGLVVASALYGRVSDTSVKMARIDRSTHGLMILEYAHHEIHDGTFFNYCDVLALGNGAVQDYLITTPNTTTWPHFGYHISFNDGQGTFEMYEAGDRTGTTLQTVYNANRNSLTAATTTIHKGQSGGTTDGTRICWKTVGSGKSADGVAASASEKILKQNTKYIIRLTNAITTTNNASIEFNFYEHADRT